MTRPPPRSTLFPTRRSSDLCISNYRSVADRNHRNLRMSRNRSDRKSTRLNSSHVKISYAVFCLKKKKKKNKQRRHTPLRSHLQKSFTTTNYINQLVQYAIQS